MPTTAEYLAAQPDFMDNFQKGSSYVDKLYSQAAQKQAGQQFAQGNYQDASATLANRGDIQGASTLQDYGQKQFQQRHAYLQQAAPVLQHIYETGGPQAVVGAFEHLAPELQGMGLDADTLNRTRQGLISDPATTLQALNAMAQRKLKFQDDGNGGVFVLDENTGQLVSHQAGNKPLILGKDQVASMPNSPTGMAPPPSPPVGGAAAPGVSSPAPMGSAAPQPSQPQAPDGYHVIATGPKGDQWRAPTPDEAKQFPGARQINTGTGEVKFAPASLIAGTPGEGGAFSPDAVRIMAEQYLSGDKSVLSNLGRGASGQHDRVAIRNEIYRQAKERGWDGSQIANAMAEFAGQTAGERTLGTRSAQAGMAVNELLPMIDQAHTAMTQVSRSGFLPWGKVQQLWQANTNDPNLRRAHAAVEAVVNTWARAINPSGQGTDSDKRRGEDMLSTAFDQKSFDAVLDQMKQEALAAKGSPAATKQEMRDTFSGGAQSGSAPQTIHYDANGNRIK